MGDPTGISGIVLAKLVDWVIEETKITIHCKENCRALHERLKDIRPLVYSVATYLSANGGGAGVAVNKWLEDLKGVLEEAGALVLQCQATVKGWNLIRRNKLSKQILNIKVKIEGICTVEAPLALLNIEGGTAKGVDETLKALAQLPVDVGNAVEGIFQPYNKQVELTLREIKEQLAMLVSRVSAQTSSSQQTDHEAEMRPVTEKTFGVAGPLKILLEFLRENRNTNYVGICGTGGIGKTRLAELAYNSEVVQDIFQRRIWLTVGNDVSIEVILPKLAKLLGVEANDLKQDEIKAKLFNKLRGMKVLLVLDDIWDNGDPMLEMLHVTSGPDTGSKILVTTRHVQLLKKEGALDQTVMMEGLSSDDSWTLFREYAFKGVDTISKEMEILATARKVAAECKGLPLALKVVARALAGKQSHSEWKRALKKLQEAKPLDRSHEIQLYKVLQYSYDELEFVEQDNRLQKCFIYFASFPEDSKVTSEKLVSLWAGEKLLEEGNEDDHGYALLQELIDRSLIERFGNVNSRVFWCSIHDVLRDFARLLIRQNRAPMKCLFSPGKGLEKFPNEWLRPDSLISDATHLSLNNNKLRSLPEELNLPKLEVLLLAHNDPTSMIMPTGFLKNLSSLKVLDLTNTHIDSLPENVVYLTNLTYLRVSWLHFSKIPSELCNLAKLEYLGLAGPTSGSLPNLFELKELRKLFLIGLEVDQLPPQFASKGAFPALKELWLDSCSKLEEFPPIEEGAFPKLQILTMGWCNRLEQLGEEFASKGVFPALKILSMRKCTSLKQLGEGFASKGVFPSLKKLNLDSCSSLEAFPPTKEGAFPALKKLCLDFCKELKEFPLTEEGAFPKLQILSMDSCSSLKQLDERFASKGVFPALKKLNLDHCSSLEAFPPTKEGAFRKLQILSMGNCSSLKQLGERFASKGVFPALKKLNLDRCISLEAFPPMKEGAFSELETLSMKDCWSIQHLGEGFASKGVFPALKELCVDFCEELKECPPTEEGAFPKLQILSMEGCSSLEQFGDRFA